MIICLKKPLIATAVFILSASSFAAERLALVIGNSNYSGKIGALTNPHYDAIRIAERLEELGFDVTLREDLTRDALAKEVTLFHRKISQNTEVAALFYAGHGVSVFGRSYIIPTDFKLEEDSAYPIEEQYINRSIEARYLIDQIAGAGAQTNIMIFDACRSVPGRASNNSFHIPNQQPYSSTLIAYSAQLGQKADDGTAGQNSPYTRALLKYLGTPDLSILETFNAANSEVNGKLQMAEIVFTSIPKVILNTSASAPTSATVPPKKPPVDSDAWLEKIWAWADEFDIPAEELPRNKEDLLAMTALRIARCDYCDNNASPKITYLPAEIGQLRNLQELFLSSNALQSLPAEIGQLNNLKELYLYDNKLRSLPPEIGQLHNLKELYLGDNEIQSLPAEIGQLRNLQKLDLVGNQLQIFLPEIGQLKNLQELYFGDNKLQFLPPEIGQLNNLSWLSLGGNQLQSLPVEIGALKNLQHLNLVKNKLQSLPPEIGELSNLQELHLFNNQLQFLPNSFSHLNYLKSLDIRNNPQLNLTNEQEEFIGGIREVRR